MRSLTVLPSGFGEHPNPTITLDAVRGMSTPILALLESSLIADSRDLHSEMLSVLTSPDTEYPNRGLTHLLRTAHEARRVNGLRDNWSGAPARLRPDRRN